MKKILLMLLVSLSFSTFNNVEIAREFKTSNNTYDTYASSDYIESKIDKVTNNYNLEYNTKRNYNYLYYFNSDNYNVSNIDDIKKAIYNGLNEGKDIITLYCSYNSNNCLNDFYSVYKNKSLMSSINNYVNPYNRYSSTNYKINISGNKTKIEITINKKYTKDEINEINSVIYSYLSKYDLNSMSDIDKIKLAHDFIIDNTIYDEDAINTGKKDIYSAYGVIKGRAICQGYAETMAIFLDIFNIPNIMISNNEHIWNLVNVNDKWLHIDTTWDDPILSNGNQIKIYDYYLITTDELINLDDSDAHNINTNYYIENKKSK